MYKAIQWTGIVLGAAGLMLAGCGQKRTELGAGGSVVSGSAGPAGTRNESHELHKCAGPIATVALVENPNGYLIQGNYNLPESPVPLVRLMAQQSACFRVVDRGAGLLATEQEQELQESGVVRKDSTVHRGKALEAQYSITPSLNFSEQEAGRDVGGLLAMIPVLDKFVGAAEQVKFKEAQVTLLLTDNETTEQVAAATGSVRVTDLGVAGLLVGKPGGAGMAGWSHSNEGKVIAAAFLDAHNRLVDQIQHMRTKSLQAPPAHSTE